MPRGPTKKYDYEKSKSKAATEKHDYRDSFKEEGANFDRGGIETPAMLSIKGKNVYMDRSSLFHDDKESLIRTLERNTLFTYEGRTGTLARLCKDLAIAEDVLERFQIMRRSILNAQDIVGLARHPKKNRDYYVLEFRCCLIPAAPLPNPIFKEILAFSPKLVGDAAASAPSSASP